MINKRKDNSYDIDGTIVAFDYGNPAIKIKVDTLCNMHDEQNLKALEMVLDQSPIVKAVKIDEKDPPRNKATKFKSVLNELVKKSSCSEILIQSTSGSKPLISSMLSLRAKGRVGPEGGFDWGYSMITITIEKNEMEAVYDIIDEIKNLFFGICTAVNAFVGYCSEHSMITQRDIYLAQAVENVHERKRLPDYNAELNDIFWLNYFGPGYVSHWGKERIKALEKAYDVTVDCNNGILVQTTAKPMIADENISKITDYDFKKALYEVLGSNTFMHETHQKGNWGEHVPTLEEQRKLV